MTQQLTKGEASRLRLLSAAAHVFAEKGYHQAKVSDIVKAADLTQAAFYLYFSSKEAIFTELVGKFREKLTHLSDIGSRITPLTRAQVPEQTEQNFCELFTFLAANPLLTRIALFESDESESIAQTIKNRIIANLRNNQAAGLTRKDLDVEIVADCVIGSIERLTLQWLFTGKKTPETLAREVVPVLLEGIMEKPDGQSGEK